MPMSEVEGCVGLHLGAWKDKGIFKSELEGVLWVCKILILTIHQYVHRRETVLLVRWFS